MANPGLVVLTGPQDQEIQESFSIPSTVAVGQIVTGSVGAFGPLGATSSNGQFTVPITEVWHLTDFYTVGTPPSGANGNVIVAVQGQGQVLTASLLNINLNSLTRFRMQNSMPWAPGSTVTLELSVSAAPSATSDFTVTWKIVRSPYTG